MELELCSGVLLLDLEGEDYRLELDDLPITEELRELKMGRVGYSCCPHAQGILMSVFEGY